MKFIPRLFVLLCAGFILATVIGTLTHEAGHYTAARLMGYNAQIQYGSTGILDYSGQKRKGKHDHIWFTLGGPIQTLLTGSIGCILLWVERRRLGSQANLTIRQWVLVFLALFWLRQPANLATWVGKYFINGSWVSRSDEIKLALYFDWPMWSVSVITALMGAGVLYAITFYVVPIAQRLTFLLAGLLGGISGYAIWFGGLGEMLIP